jgi:phenylacetate-CoA ligase
VRFRTRDGGWINNLEVTHLLRPFPLSRFRLHQDAAGVLHLDWEGSGIEVAALRRALLGLFGSDQPLNLGALPPEPVKRVQYSSELPGAHP